ncbi:hypothetical protein DRN73_05660 [Candidatus Pacearchaeota archaeon]|nr:MAG: hypothetical protein DRN73_05660 [Candidatus Pacearchaeota archaeon]
MKVELSWSGKDIFKSLKYGFSVKKIWMFVIGWIVGLGGYAVLTYIASLISGYSLKEIWHVGRYIPIPKLDGISLNTPGYILWIVGIIWFIVVMAFTFVAVAKVTFEQLRGDEFYAIKDAFSFAFKEGKGVILAPLSIAIVILILIIAGIILGYIMKIPYVGEILFFIFAIPVIFVSYLIVYLAISFVVSLLYSAGVIGSSGADTFDTLFEIFSTINEQFFRWLWYSILTLFCMVIGGGLFSSATVFAWKIPLLVLGKVTPKYAFLMKKAIGYLPVHLQAILPSVFNITANPVKDVVTLKIVGFLMGLILYLWIFVLISYPMSIGTVGTVINFLIVAKKKDDIDYLSQQEEEEEEEEIVSTKENEEKKEE